MMGALGGSGNFAGTSSGLVSGCLAIIGFVSSSSSSLSAKSFETFFYCAGATGTGG